jgi:hypothetical protein
VTKAVPTKPFWRFVLGSDHADLVHLSEEDYQKVKNGLGQYRYQPLEYEAAKHVQGEPWPRAAA